MSVARDLLYLSEAVTRHKKFPEWKEACEKKAKSKNQEVKYEVSSDKDMTSAWLDTKIIGLWSARENEGYVY